MWGKEGKAADTMDCFFDEPGDLPRPVPRRATVRDRPRFLVVEPALRKLPGQEAAKRFKGVRWALLSNPGHLCDDQAVTLRKLKRRGRDLWRACARRPTTTQRADRRRWLR